MALELLCGSCGKRLLVETMTAASCPDCGSPMEPAVDTPTTVFFKTDTPPGNGSGEDFTLAESLRAGPPATPSPAADSMAIFHPVPGPDAGTSIGAATTVPAGRAAPVPVLELAPPSGVGLGTASPGIRPAAPEPPPAPRMSTAAATAGPSPFWFRIAISYASAVTIICLYLAYLLFHRNPTLDLPDIAPPAKKGNRVTKLIYIPPDTLLPPEHQLSLGESRRFGSVVVTPLRVTRGPIDFTYYAPGTDETRPPTQPVLKLHLRFENASSGQEFAPLDRQLVFTKEPDPAQFGQFKANNFVCRTQDRTRHDQHLLVYDLSPDSPWLIRGENLDRELQPGTMVETFIPTTEVGDDALEGGLVWRVHLRKGYNPRSFRGVTTLVEVQFDSTQIIEETAVPSDT